ncbi:hypothetical protein OQA88_9550 [Cercophora sp. LCS_1]
MVQKLKAELCEDWLQDRAERWGPTKRDDNTPPSWTGTITTKVGSAFHYITCPGHLDGKPCVGSWSRKDRHTAAVGLHCTYGGWVTWDSDKIINSQLSEEVGTAPLQRLRRLWAEHVLQQSTTTGAQKGHHDLAGIWDQAVMDKVHEMLNKVTAQKSKRATEKLMGQGSGGWSGVNENGIVLKRDPGSRTVGNYKDRCDLEPGGIWQRGDVDVWTVWNGWSCLASRDGRWRPAYHLEVILCLWMTVVDYGSTRAAYRDRQADWLRATEWLWVNTPPDVPRRCLEVFKSDTTEMIKREIQRMKSLRPGEYVADDISTSAQRYKCFQDRAGEVIAYHSVGEGLETPRGLVATWAMCVLNDLIDYERDVLCGETNNFVRGLTSSQQVVDAAAWILEAVCWAMDNRDNDLTNAILGTAALYLVTWRYNGPKMARYESISIREKRPGTPPEMEDIANIIRPTAAEIRGDRSYGELFTKAKERVQALYSGCTCRTHPEGHDAWQLFAQAMDDGGNDGVEEQLHVALVALNNGANAGDVNTECGVDLLTYECFVRFLDPDSGLVTRVHYRSGNIERGNTVTE